MKKKKNLYLLNNSIISMVNKRGKYIMGYCKQGLNYSRLSILMLKLSFLCPTWDNYYLHLSTNSMSSKNVPLMKFYPSCNVTVVFDSNIITRIYREKILFYRKSSINCDVILLYVSYLCCM